MPKSAAEEQDLSEFEGPGVVRCPLALAELPDEQASKLAAAMASPRIKGTRIAAVLNGWGHKVSADSIQRHRRGACACGR